VRLLLVVACRLRYVIVERLAQLVDRLLRPRGSGR
jgi:hypothetical protein